MGCVPAHAQFTWPEGKSAAIVLSAVTDGKVSLIAGVTSDLTAKVKAGDLVNHVAQQVGGKGGGRADMAQAGGTDASKLPAALGDWAGQEFLRIHFAESDPAALHERLGEVVDETAATVRDGGQKQRLDGMAIVDHGSIDATASSLLSRYCRPE